MFLVVILLYFASPVYAWDGIYKVAFRHFPDTLSPIENARFAGSFLIWQMVHPFFYFDDTKDLKSKILDLERTKATNSEFNEFKFCILPNLRFGDETIASGKDLEDAFDRLKNSVEGFSHIKSLQPDGSRCVRVRLSQRDLRFFEKLTGVAASLYRFDPRNPLQLNAVGDYKIKLIKKDVIELEATESIKASTLFKSIILKLYDEKDNWNQTDLNFVSGLIQAPVPQNSFSAIMPPTKKMYSIVVNLRSKKKRKCFASIIEPKSLNSILNIEVKSMYGFLPSELLGANEHFKPDLQVKKHCSEDMEFTWHDFRIQNKEVIEQYFQSIATKNKIKINVVFHNLEDLIKLSESGKEYITAISFNSSGSRDVWNSDSAVFFEPFVRKPGFFIFPLPGLNEAVKSAATEDQIFEKTAHLRRAHRLLLDSGFVYPLGEVNKSFFYPKSLKIIPWAVRVSGTPLVSGMK